MLTSIDCICITKLQPIQYGITMYFDWENLVFEAKQKRKKLNITQKKLAAITGVSEPTIVDFEKAKTSVSLEKVIRILKALDMLAIPKPPLDTLDAFILDAYNKRQELMKSWELKLKSKQTWKNCYINTDAYVNYAFELNEPVKELTNPAFFRQLQNIYRHADMELYELDAHTIESHLFHQKITEKELLHHEYKSIHFWRASRKDSIYMYWQTPLKEDLFECIHKPGSILDRTLPIILATEFIIFIHRLTNALYSNPKKVPITMKAKYAGLQKRILCNWTQPMVPFYDNRNAINDAVELTMQFTVDMPIAHIVHSFLKQLYANFDNYELSHRFVEEVLKRPYPTHSDNIVFTR